MLIWTAGEPEETEYSIFAIALAMYLMVSIAAPDVRAGYVLLFWGKSVAHRIFGATLLCSFTLLTVASMKVMFADATDNAELVVDAAVILFVTEMVSIPDSCAGAFSVSVRFDAPHRTQSNYTLQGAPHDKTSQQEVSHVQTDS